MGNTKHMRLPEIALASVLALAAASAEGAALTIDTSDYFAYSEPFHGNQTLFLSRQACSVKIVGIAPALLARFEVEPAGQRQNWSKALLDTRFGAVENCWASIRKGKEEGVLTCNVEGGALSSHCTILAKSYFIDTANLPKAPARARF